MALNRSPEFKSVTVQIVCVIETQTESAGFNQYKLRHNLPCAK